MHSDGTMRICVDFKIDNSVTSKVLSLQAMFLDSGLGLARHYFIGGRLSITGIYTCLAVSGVAVVKQPTILAE